MLASPSYYIRSALASYSAGRANYPLRKASYSIEYVLGVLHSPLDMSCLPDLTDTNRGC